MAEGGGGSSLGHIGSVVKKGGRLREGTGEVGHEAEPTPPKQI